MKNLRAFKTSLLFAARGCQKRRLTRCFSAAGSFYFQGGGGRGVTFGIFLSADV